MNLASRPEPALTAAQILLEKINAGEITDRMSVYEVSRHQWSGLRDTKTIHSGLEYLESRHWLKVISIKTGGRPSENILLNPEINCENC